MIHYKINTVLSDAIGALHKFIFEEETQAEDFEKRQQLKNFKGFPFELETPKYKKKVAIRKIINDKRFYKLLRNSWLGK